MHVGRSAVAIVCLLVGAGCASTKVAFQTSPLAPAAVASAKVRLDGNQNTLVEVKLEHAAPAPMLWPPRQVYVVWAEGTEGRLFQLGQLRVNEDRSGHFEGTTALERFRLLITAEDDPHPERPSQPYVLATDFVSAQPGWVPFLR